MSKVISASVKEGVIGSYEVCDAYEISSKSTITSVDQNIASVDFSIAQSTIVGSGILIANITGNEPGTTYGYYRLTYKEVEGSATTSTVDVELNISVTESVEYTSIQLKRTTKDSFADLSGYNLDYGEPLYAVLNDGSYFVVGSSGSGSVKINNEKRLKFMTQDMIDRMAFKSSDGKSILDQNGNKVDIELKSEKVYYNDTTTIQSAVTDIYNKMPPIQDATTTNMPIVGWDSTSSRYHYNTSVYVNCSTGVLMGAAWNDFAEYRKCQGQPGTVVCETGDGDLLPSSERLQAGASVISDTCGMVIGKNEKNYQPIAVAGRVLVSYMGEKSQYKAGDAVCAAQFGRIDKMTREEIKEYPDRILGYVSEIPTYEEWNGVKINNRIWIKIK